MLAFVDNAPMGRGFHALELTTALKHPSFQINGYPMSAFEPEPLPFAITSAKNYQALERSLADAASGNSAKEVSVLDVQGRLKAIDGYDATRQTLFNRPVSDYMTMTLDEMVDARIHARSAPAPISPALKAAGIVGTAIMAQEFAVAGHKWVELKFQGNDAGADATAARFIGPNVGGALGGFVAGVSIGAATGSPTGPFALISAAGGGMLGAYLGDKWADQKAIEQVFNQEDQLKRVWSRDPVSPDGRWFRGAHQQQLQSQDLGTGVEVRPLQTNLGDDVTFHSRYVATGTMERYLNWKAAQASYELGLSKRPETVDPYRLSAKDEVEPPRSQFETDRTFVRDSISREWEMHITEREDARVSTTHRVDVSPERAELLDAQSRLVIAENAANTPAAVAARYMVAYEQGRWSDFGDKDNPSIPAAVQNARENADTLVASDGSKYTRTGEGIWVHQGIGSTRNAAGNVLDELELTWQSQSEGIAGLAAMASEVRASLQVAPEGVRGLVEALYRKHGIERSEEMLAATSAVLTHKLEVAGSSTDVVLELIPDPRTHAPSADSAIAAFIDGGGNRMVLKGTATADDVSEYIAQLRTEPSELPVRDAAQLQIDRLSVQERDAHEQAQREANRQGLSADQAGQVAMMAAAQVGSLEPGQISDALDVVPSFSHTGSGSTGGGDVAAAEAGRMAEAARVAAMSATEAAIPVEPGSARLNNDAPQVPTATHPEAEALHHQTQQREQEAARAEQDRALQEQAATPAIEPQAPEAQVRQQPTDHRASVQPAHSPDNTATETHVTAAHLHESAQASSTEAQHVTPLNPEGDPSAHKVDAPSEPVTPHAEELAEQEGAQVPDYQDALLASQLPVYEAHPEEAMLLQEQAESAEVPVHAVPEPEPPHADEPARNRLEPSDPAHPANALYRQVREQVEKLDQSLGRTYDDTSERLTGSLMVLAKEGGLQRVDHVVLSNQVGDQRPGFNVFVVQGELSNPAHRRAVMPTEQAVTTPHEESLERLDVLLERDAQQEMQANMQREQDRERINEEHGRAMMMSGGG